MQTDNGSRPRAENETPEGDRKRQEMLEEIVDEAIMATKEGKMRWEEFFRPNAFRSQVHRDRENLLDLEIHHEQDTGRIRTAIRHNGDLVTSFHPARQEELQEMMERLQRSAIREEGKIRWTLNSVRKLRQHGAKGEAATMHSVTRKVRELDQSGQEEIELEARITFTDPPGTDGRLEDLGGCHRLLPGTRHPEHAHSGPRPPGQPGGPPADRHHLPVQSREQRPGRSQPGAGVGGNQVCGPGKYGRDHHGPGRQREHSKPGQGPDAPPRPGTGQAGAGPPGATKLSPAQHG